MIKLDEQAPVPWRSSLVCLLRVMNGEPQYTHGISEKREWLRSAESLWLIWPGQWRTEIFDLSGADRARALEVLG